MNRTLQRSLILIILLCLLALSIALFSQHIAGMRPCAWCVLQRLILIAVALASALTLIITKFNRRTSAAVGSTIVTALSVSGVITAWYQYHVAASLFSCNQTFADRFITQLGLDSALPALFGIYATCMDARVNLLGVEYALWGLILFIVLTIISGVVLLHSLRRQTP